MAFFDDDRSRLVPQLIHAQLLSADVEQLATDDGDVLIRADYQPEDQGRWQVAVISGGGSGHEPAHAGFLGEGMLTAAVPGSLFASPPVSAVLAAIRAVTGDAGALLVIKNYTGDRLNFGLAAERAREEGYQVETVLVSDDVALPEIDQPRGLAGTLLVHKTAGHLAAQGAPLADVAEAARRTSQSLRTIGLALSPAHLPGSGREDDTRGPELGLGIHNEPGARRVQVTSAADAVEQVLTALQPEDLTEDGDVVAVLNDMGGCSSQEGMVLAAELIDQLGADQITRLIGPAQLMTSLDMHGFSITLAPATAELVEAVDAATQAPAWPGARALHTPQFREQQASPVGGPGQEDTGAVDASEKAGAVTQDGTLERAVRAGCVALEDARQELDELDRVAGDADAGETFGAGAAAVRAMIDEKQLGFAEPAAALQQISRRLESAMGGSSGVLLAIFFTAAGRAFAQTPQWGSALEAGVLAVQHHGGATAGDRTMLDALIPLQRAVVDGSTAGDVAAAADEGAQQTAQMSAAAGRAAYVPGELAQGAPDAGAAAVSVLARAMAEAMETRA